MAYRDATYASRNPLRRLSHGARFTIAADLVAAYCRPNQRVLDYGSGDGYFLGVLKDRGFAPIGFDPVPYIRGAGVIADLSDAGSFDCITCLEVLEHINDAETEKVFANMRRILNPSGTVIISVPVMTGPIVIPKAIGTVIRGHDKQWGYNFPDFIKCVFGKAPRRVAASDGMYFHMGFDHRVVRARLRKVFQRIEERNSPFPPLPDWANSQVFFVCQGFH